MNQKLLRLAEKASDAHGYVGLTGDELIAKIQARERIGQWGGDWIDVTSDDLYELLEELPVEALLVAYIMGTEEADRRSMHDPVD